MPAETGVPPVYPNQNRRHTHQGFARETMKGVPRPLLKRCQGTTHTFLSFSSEGITPPPNVPMTDFLCFAADAQQKVDLTKILFPSPLRCEEETVATIRHRMLCCPLCSVSLIGRLRITVSCSRALKNQGVLSGFSVRRKVGFVVAKRSGQEVVVLPQE
ncbi:hypothetical protein L228DRAFT_165336 [Xylona heveae TC161]|uniref:Uncharacterized protein n=1 Tax=Xylona heveae (strain CBS 132557 / TC161) TaxID=1328760 RepID=A0A165FJJ2_XYLHT|nr:hypothetical protein L228DRAFT_165336 [Xylona heveae TC161]KZF21049.1 hypothetical protein L228DRAFT_165336 [Xylona heveae TC161]